MESGSTRVNTIHWELFDKEKVMKISEIRLQYEKGSLNEQIVGDEPLVFFEKWLQESINAKVMEPTAMVLSTCDSNGRPASRVVLLKGLSENSLHFYTNYLSPKGNHIELNNQVALLFFWPELERQVRFVGVATKISENESDEYFNSRPVESRVGAVISPQSRVISNRSELETAYKQMIDSREVESIQRPEHWGGYAVSITEAEFWQGRPGRLHDRIRFRSENNKWIKERLAP